MYSIIFILQGLMQLALLVWLVRIYRRTGLLIALLMFVPQLGLIWDNLIVGSGRWIGLGETLQALSWPRFWIHWLMGSWLIVLSGAVLRLAGFSWAQKKWVMAGFCLLTVALMLHELPLFWSTSLHPVCELDLVRYSTSVRPEDFCFPDQVAVRSGGALAPIVTCIVVIGAGLVLWIRRGFAWMFLGALLMFISAAPPLRAYKLDNFGEVLIMLGCFWALSRFAGARRTRLAREPAAHPA